MTEITDLFQELGVEYLTTGHHHCRTGWVQLRHCPFCHSDNYHLGFRLSTKVFFCWRCRFHLTVEVLQRLGATSGQIARVWGTQGTARALAPSPKTPRAGLKEPTGRGPLQSAHIEYLLSRKFDPNEISHLWEVEGIGIHEKLSWRLYIPIIQAGKRVSWTTRTIGDRNPLRYLSASAAEEAVNHKECLYGEDLANHSVCIVEGPTDAWNIGPGAVATLGTGFTTAQVRRLVRFPYRYVCFDSSDTAQRIAKDLCEALSCFAGVTEQIVLDADDPGSASPSEIKLLRRVCKL